jgi:hypothetical protein
VLPIAHGPQRTGRRPSPRPWVRAYRLDSGFRSPLANRLPRPLVEAGDHRYRAPAATVDAQSRVRWPCQPAMGNPVARHHWMCPVRISQVPTVPRYCTHACTPGSSSSGAISTPTSAVLEARRLRDSSSVFALAGPRPSSPRQARSTRRTVWRTGDLAFGVDAYTSDLLQDDVAVPSWPCDAGRHSASHPHLS